LNRRGRVPRRHRRAGQRGRGPADPDPARHLGDGHRQGQRRKTVGSSLTAVDLAGLTRVELSFALVLAAAAGGLVFTLGLAERRRTFAIISALGAEPRHQRRLIFSEAAVLTVVGGCTGAVLG